MLKLMKKNKFYKLLPQRKLEMTIELYDGISSAHGISISDKNADIIPIKGVTSYRKKL